MQLAKHWRLKAQRYRLVGSRSRTTGAVSFPPPALLTADDEPLALSGAGTLWSWSEVAQGRPELGGRYVIAMIKLDEGPLITAQLTDCRAADLDFGLPVEMVTRKLRDLGPDGLLVYGYKFRPRLEA